ncbi:MAG: DUF58 domain-containing protein [Solirubrobacterales bacterium]|nr:DUF58 domain-containing protein [Solirubrobacterales bacterium]
MLRPLATALLGGLLCLIGGAFDTASLYVPGIALAALSIGAVAWVSLAAAGANVERSAVAATAVEDEPFPLRIEARLGFLPAPGGRLTDPQSDAGAPLGGRRRVVLDAQATLPRRGPATLAPSVLEIADPLGLCVRRVRGRPGPELLVLPRIEPVAATAGGGGAGGGSQPGLGGGTRSSGSWRDDASDGIDLDGLRPYREGTPASRIHWATYARRGVMMERRMVAERTAAALVVLDAAAPAGDDELDSAVRAAASLAVALARLDGAALLLPGDRRPVEIAHDLSAWPAAHRRLALVQGGVRAQLSGLGAGTETLVWVTASDVAALPRGFERIPAGARYLVAPRLPEGATAAFTVAGCAGMVVDRSRRSAAA